MLHQGLAKRLSSESILLVRKNNYFHPGTRKFFAELFLHSTIFRPRLSGKVPRNVPLGLQVYSGLEYTDPILESELSESFS